MKVRNRLTIIYVFLIHFSLNVNAKDYEPFIIKKLGESIYDGVFTGNGLLGTMTYLRSKQHLVIDVGRTDAYDHQGNDVPSLFGKARLPIGSFELKFQHSRIDSSEGIIDLNEANALAKVYTSKGVLSVKTISLSEKDLIIIEIDKSKLHDTYDLTFVPYPSISPRTKASWVKQPTNYRANESPGFHKKKEVFYVNQQLQAGGGYVTAYKWLKRSEVKDIIVATVGYSQRGTGYVDRSLKDIKDINYKSLDSLVGQHQKWWGEYMQLSDYNLPDKDLQRFYDMQMYKLGCLTRSDKPAIDLQGPWPTIDTPWPAYWFNLNFQLTYSPLYTSNRLNIAESLIKMLDKNVNGLKESVHPDYRFDSYALQRSGPPDLSGEIIKLHTNNNGLLLEQESELSNLTWVLYYYYLHYRYSMNQELKRPLYKLLKGSVNFALHFLSKNKEGKYEFSIRTHSPEYPKSFDFNTNYDLSSLQWGIQTLLELGQSESAEKDYLERIRMISKNLIDYPRDSNGFKISSNQSFEQSHRHYSHLLMIYPYHLIHADEPKNIRLIKTSLAHWQSKKSALQGYSYSGASSMYALLGQGDSALRYLKELHVKYIQPNTLYKEAGPVIETPLSMATSLQELSLQCWNGIVRIFPAVPTEWENISFKDFRSEGAFLISANKTDGITKTVEVFSEYGGEVKLQIDQHMAKIDIIGTGKLIKRKYKYYELALEKGSKAVFTN